MCVIGGGCQGFFLKCARRKNKRMKCGVYILMVDLLLMWSRVFEACFFLIPSLLWKGAWYELLSFLCIGRATSMAGTAIAIPHLGINKKGWP